LEHHVPGRSIALLLALLTLSGCAGLPGRGQPRPPELPLTQPPSRELTAPLTALGAAHPGLSGYRLYQAGIDGLLLRLELIARAHRSLDLQYYILRGDESGRLVTEALLAAAQRGVRVRVLVDDGESAPGDEQLWALAGDPHVAIRVFNPWHYRGHNGFLRGLEFLGHHGRLDYRMHNKLFIADGAVALIGGRNIGDQYFQVDPGSQYADDDVLVSGATVGELAGTFELFWASDNAVPLELLVGAKARDAAAVAQLAQRHTEPRKASSAGSNFGARLAAGEPLADLMSGAAPLSFASAELARDLPDKRAADGAPSGSLMFGPIAAAIRGTHTQFLMVTPYLIPTQEELTLLKEAGTHDRRVKILTSSLEASNDPAAQAGYEHYRVPLLKAGVQLYELRREPDSPRGTGQPRHMSRYGNFGLHAKLLVFDSSALYVGSLNFDARSRRLNTEIGLIIHSGELTQEVQRRFEAMTQPANAYEVTLIPEHPGKLKWSTLRAGEPLTLTREPARSDWERLEVASLSLLPLDEEL
jgi:putative cardiolipin synthase